MSTKQHPNVISETKDDKSGATTIVFNPDQPLDRLWWAIRSMFEKPEHGALVRNLEILEPKGGPELTHGGGFRHEVVLRIVVDSEEPKTHKELETQMYRESLDGFVEQYFTDANAAMMRPSGEVQRYLRGIEADCKELGIPTEGKSLKEILVEMKAAKLFRHQEKQK